MHVMLNIGDDNMNFKIFDEKVCACGKYHTADLKNVVSGKGALLSLPGEVKALGATKVFIMADTNTDCVAGQSVRKLLEENNIPYSEYIFNKERIVNAKDYGVPQSRQRYIYLLSKKEETVSWEFPAKEDHVITLREAIGHLPSLDPELREPSERWRFPDFEEKIV